MTKCLMVAALVCLALSSITQAAARRIVVYEGVATEVADAADQSTDLWVTLKDLTRATKFVVKPQGVCRDQLCFPIPKGRKDQFLSKRASTTWFNLSEFARLLKQPVAFDAKNAVWYFGVRPDQQGGYLSSLEAPDFRLPDMNGRMHSLSDFRGKRVLLLTWASW